MLRGAGEQSAYGLREVVVDIITSVLVAGMVHDLLLHGLPNTEGANVAWLQINALNSLARGYSLVGLSRLLRPA